MFRGLCCLVLDPNRGTAIADVLLTNTHACTHTRLCQVFWHVFKMWVAKKQKHKKQTKTKKNKKDGEEKSKLKCLKKEGGSICVKAKCKVSSYASHRKIDRSTEEGDG